MSCLGVHFALTDAEIDVLRGFAEEQERRDYIGEVIEEEYFSHQREFLAQSDKSWDAMHRSLADGELTWHGGEFPLNHVVLGGELLYTQDDYIISLKSSAQVSAIAAALQSVDEAEFRRRYFAIDEKSYGFGVSEEDFSYTWNWFQEVRDLYVRAAAAGRAVVFTADQ